MYFGSPWNLSTDVCVKRMSAERLPRHAPPSCWVFWVLLPHSSSPVPTTCLRIPNRETRGGFCWRASCRACFFSLRPDGFRRRIPHLGVRAGKSHLINGLLSLAIAAAEAGRRVYYGTLAGLIESLTEAKAAGNLTRRLRVLTHPALLVVDEIGYLPVNQDGAVLFFQLINARHERASTVLTSNKGFEDWGGVLGGEVMAAALIDRLVHHCHIVNIRGNSYRMRDHQNLLQAGSDRSRKRGAS